MEPLPSLRPSRYRTSKTLFSPCFLARFLLSGDEGHLMLLFVKDFHFGFLGHESTKTAAS